MAETFKFNKKRNFNIIVEDTFMFFSKNARPLFNCYLAFCCLPLLATFFLQLNESNHLSASPSGPFAFFSSINIEGIVFFFISGLLEGVVAISTFYFVRFYKINNGAPPSVKELWSQLKFDFGVNLIIYLTIKFVLKVAFKLLWLPGFYLWPPLSLVLPCYILGGLTVINALKKSFQLVKNNFVIILSVLIAFYVAIYLVILLPQAPIYFLTTGSFKPKKIILPISYRIIIAAITQIMQVLFILPNLAISLFYFSSQPGSDDIIE